MINAIAALATFHQHSAIDAEGRSFLSLQDKISIGQKISRNKRQKQLNELLVRQEQLDQQISDLEELLNETEGK